MTIEERFWTKVNIKAVNDCWEWLGAKNNEGYGLISRESTRVLVLAHRLAYELTIGTIDNNKIIMHSCDNPSCCNPYHLIQGTQRDNMRDMSSKKRQSQYNSNKTHCKRGHEYTPENTYKSKRGERQCKKCMAMHNRLSRGRKKEIMYFGATI